MCSGDSCDMTKSESEHNDSGTNRQLAGSESTVRWHGSADEGSPWGAEHDEHNPGSPIKPKLCDSSGEELAVAFGCTARELFGNVLVPDGHGNDLMDRLCYFREKPGSLMSAVDGWEKVTLMVDSGASDTVIPPSVCSLAQLHHTPKVGI